MSKRPVASVCVAVRQRAVRQRVAGQCLRAAVRPRTCGTHVEGRAHLHEQRIGEIETVADGSRETLI